MADIKIGVDADDATRSIEALRDVFERFHVASEKQTETWAGVGKEVAGLRGGVDALGQTMAGVVDAFAAVAGHQDRLDHATERTARRWQQLGRHAKDFAGHVKGATDSILKWAGIGGLIVGAAGFGAEHALFDMAANVGARRSTALGLNTTYGGLAAARVDYQRFGDADSTLDNIAGAQSGDPSKRLGLSNMHVAFQGRDSMDVMADAMGSVSRLLDKRPNSIPLQQYAQNYKLDEIFSLDTLQRMQGHGDEVRETAAKMRGNRKGLDLAPDVQKKWQDLSTQISTAAKNIETKLINKLVAVAPGLQKLSDALVKTAGVFFAKDGPADDWLKEINSGLEKFAGYIDTDDFKRDVSDLLENLGSAAKTMWEIGKSAMTFLHWLAQLTGADVSAGADASANASADATNGGGLTSLTPGGGIDLSNNAGGGLGVGLRKHRFGAGAGLGRRGLSGGGDLSPVDQIPEQPATNARLAEDRKGLLDELDKNDKLRREVIKVATMENNGSAKSMQTVIESMTNRARMHGSKSLHDEIFSGFYGPVNRGEDGGVDGPLTAKEKADGLKALAAVRGGGNLIGYRTDQGMLTDNGARRYMQMPDKSGWAKVEGENYFYMGDAGKRYAREQIAADRRAAVAPAKVTVSTNPGGNPHVAAAAAAAPQ